MGIKFNCPACGRPLNVKSELAGKRGRCPKCQAKIDIPAEDSGADAPAATQLTESPGAGPGTQPTSTDAAPSGGSVSSTVAAASAAGGSGSVVAEEPTKTWVASQAAGNDPIGEAPNLQWYAMPPGAANQYGPASGEEFRVWMKEGRIPADALVWRQDWPEWKRAGAVFPQLAAPAAVASLPAATAASIPTAAATAPMASAATPVAQPAFPLPGTTPGMPPTAQASAPVADAFPVMPTEPATVRGAASRSSRTYRPRSNTGPIIAIVVLLLAMIPLTFFVWKVVSEQIVAPVPPSATSAVGSSETDKSETDDAPPAGSNEPEE
ncbi:MAG TPA: DUF4339 domain-containing protein [Pirellulales bacterium]|jgi:hypothetical protein|nr:DUF4339 domain-containing protein [Pirellulales bacterium]